MKVSRSAGYALIAVGYITENYRKGAVLASRVSKEYDIPVEYLLKILQQLVRANILKSKRGPHGGFSLAHPAFEITILRVIEAVDGPMVNHLHLARQANNAPFSIKMEEVCDRAIRDIRTTYGNAKFSELATV